MMRHLAYQMDWLGGPQYANRLVNDSSNIPSQGRFVPLDEPIHPLWRQDAFRKYWLPASDYVAVPEYDHDVFDCDDDFYLKITPALRLASVLLRRARKLMVYYYRAPIIRQQDGSRDYDRHWRPSDLDEAYFDYMMHDFADSYRIMRLRPNLADVAIIHGLTATLTDSNTLPAQNYLVCSAVSHEGVSSFDGLEWWNKPQADSESVLAHFAQLLVHELAHAIYARRCIEERYEYLNDNDWLIRSEPRIFPASFSELGNVCSHYLFGFEHAITWLRTTPDGQSHLPFYGGQGGLRALFQSSFELYQNVVVYQVAPETIHSYFNQLTWDPRPEDWGQLPELRIYLMPRLYDWDQHFQAIHMDPNNHPDPTDDGLPSRFVNLHEVVFTDPDYPSRQ